MNYLKKYLLFTVLGILMSSLLFSQPTTPENILKTRREKVLKEIGDGVAILPGLVRNSYGSTDENLAKNFYYLTGFEDSGAWCILEPGSEAEYSLFVRPFNPGQMVWTGMMPGIEGTKQEFNPDKVYSSREFKTVLKEVLARHDKVFIPSGNRWLREYIVEVGGEKDLEILDLLDVLAPMRLVKDEHEIAMTRKAVDITSMAHQNVLKMVAPGKNEYEVEATIEYTFRNMGATGPAFASIVGSGPRATILHYKDNDHKIKDGDLIVMDIGAEYNHYKADVTRTIPANGKFSKEQAEIYNIVLKAQEASIAVMKPGELYYRFNEVASEIILQGMKDLGLLTDIKSDWQNRIANMYFVGHSIGLDIHDINRFSMQNSRSLKFEPGMIVTCEPGIYLHPDLLTTLHERMSRVPKEEIDAFIKEVSPAFEKYSGIGVRIEDDILITKDGNEILSKSAPKTIKEIENLINNR